MIIAFCYHAAGRMITKSYPNGVSDTTTMTYDGLNRLTGVATPTESVDYGYDALGRKTGRTENAATTFSHPEATSDITAYETDSQNNLTREYLTGPGGLIAQTDHSGAP